MEVFVARCEHRIFDEKTPLSSLELHLKKWSAAESIGIYGDLVIYGWFMVDLWLVYGDLWWLMVIISVLYAASMLIYGWFMMVKVANKSMITIDV